MQREEIVFPHLWCFIISKATEEGKVERAAGTMASI